MAFALTVATTHTKTLLSPSTGSADKVYGSDYVSASSHTSAVSVAGATSGGVIYADSTTTLASSALLAANALVIGGGAGAAPSTVAALTWGPTAGQGLTAAAGTAVTDVALAEWTRTNNNAAVVKGFRIVYTDTTSAAGFLPFQVLGGASATTNLLSVSKAGALTIPDTFNSTASLLVDNGNVRLVGASSTGYVQANEVAIRDYAGTGSAPLKLGSGGVFAISSATNPTSGASDTGLSRISAGVIGVGTGAAGSIAGGIQLASIAGGSTGGTLTLSNTAGAWGTYALGTATTDVGVRYTQTWNAAGVTFTGHKFTITDTASASGSLAVQYLGGAAGTTNLLKVDKNGYTTAPIFIVTADGNTSTPSLQLSGTQNGFFRVSGVNVIGVTVGGQEALRISVPATGVLARSDSVYSFSSNTSYAAADSGLSRISAGLIGVGTGAAGSFAGRLKLTSAIAAGVAVGSLNASPTTGEIQSVTDALTPVAGAAVAAGGAAKALVWWNGAQWTVVAV